MLREFCTLREALENSRFSESSRHIFGSLMVESAHLPLLEILQENGHLETITESGKNISYLPDAVGHRVDLTLNIRTLCYFESVIDLISFTSEEPEDYYVHRLGNSKVGTPSPHPAIEAYRAMLRARKLLRLTADYETPGVATFQTPERIDIPLAYKSAITADLTNLANLESQLLPGPQQSSSDRDQRLVLFRKSLREFLKSHPPDQRFGVFLSNFETIFDSYSRDYQLWVGNSFGELEKSFEEKRLKFVGDLNGILAGVQTSILAVPVAALLLGDKYDPANPLKNFLLAGTVALLGLTALKLLENQGHTLEAIRHAIDAVKTDFEKKQTHRKEEFKSRLASLDAQEHRVRHLMEIVRKIINGIMIAGGIAWLISFLTYTSNHGTDGKGTGKPAGRSAANMPSRGPSAKPAMPTVQAPIPLAPPAKPKNP